MSAVNESFFSGRKYYRERWVKVIGVEALLFLLSYCSQVPFLCTHTVGPASEGSARVLTVCVPYEIRGQLEGFGNVKDRYRAGKHWILIVNCSPYESI